MVRVQNSYIFTIYLSVFDKEETIFTLHILKAESQSIAAFEWVLSQIYFVVVLQIFVTPPKQSIWPSLNKHF